MSSKMFQLDKSELRKLAKFFKRAPQMANRAAAAYLNTVALGTRKEALKIINQRLVIRSPTFIKKNIWAQLARKGKPLDKLQSEIGSRLSERFSGLVEQELGIKAELKRQPTLFARGGNPGRKIKPSVRMRAQNQFRSPDDFEGKNAAHRVVVMLAVSRREKYRRPFIIKKHPKFVKGLYRLRRGSLKLVQRLEPINISVKRVRWLTGGEKQFFKRNKPREIWREVITHELKGAKLRKRR